MNPYQKQQYVFTIPKMLRVYFRRDRRLLGKLSQCAADALKTLFHACKDPAAVPGIIIAIQTYGDLVNFHPHLHALVTDGTFSPTGWFVAFPKIDLYTLEHLFRHRVLHMLFRERRIDETVIRKLLGWRHSGFSLHNAVRIDWLAALTAHIPNAGEHLVRYYGWYSNVSRGKRQKALGEASTVLGESSELSPSVAKRAWARLIKQVYEVDPLVCPRCAGPMRLIAFIEQPEVIEKILTHLGLWPAPAHSPPVAALAA